MFSNKIAFMRSEIKTSRQHLGSHCQKVHRNITTNTFLTNPPSQSSKSGSTRQNDMTGYLIPKPVSGCRSTKMI